MVFTVKWSEDASAALDEIAEYLTEVAGEQTAAKIVNGIVRRVRILATQPTIGQHEWPFDDSPYYDFRRLLEGNYKIVYFIDEPNVIISTIFDTRQNPAKLRKIVMRAVN
jgi:plasmid stabilization system protein ParE